MKESEIVERLLGLARESEPDELLETTAATLHADLYDAAADAFGSWDAALAAALCVRLEKPGAYVLNPDAALPTVEEGRRGVRLVGIAGGLVFVGAGVVAWL